MSKYPVPVRPNRMVFSSPVSLHFIASSIAIRIAIDEAMKCKETGEEKTILFGLTGTGYFDMYAYEKFHNGEMSDYIPTDEDLKAGLAGLPKF